MGTPQKHILVIAGEASGDMRAAGLIKALQERDPSLVFSGVGGTYMQQQSVNIIENIDQLGVVGIWEVVKHLPVIKKVFDKIIRFVDSNPITAVILVDYPGFNLRLAKTLKEKGIKVIYYVSPQVWAWKEKRILTIKKIVDVMLVLFPFEKEIYAKYGMNVDYVGHPLLDEVKMTEPPASVKARLGFKPPCQVIGLLPGSREKEITRHLPVMLDAAKLLMVDHPNRKFVVFRAPTISKELLELFCRERNVAPLIYDGPLYNGMGAMDAMIVASGTATLEAGLLLKPMVIMYKTAWLTYFVAKAFLKIPYIGLVNVVAGKKIIDEYIQNDATAANLASGIDKILSSPNAYGQTTNDLARLKNSLGASGASRRAADVVLKKLF